MEYLPGNQYLGSEPLLPPNSKESCLLFILFSAHQTRVAVQRSEYMAGKAGSILAAATRGGGGRMERWGQPLRVIAQDYVEVTKDAYKDAKAKPIKTLVYTLIGGCLVATWKTRPDADSYIDCLLENCNEFHLCSQVVRSRQTQEYLENIATKLSRD